MLSRRNFFSYGSMLAIAGGTVLNTGCWFTMDVFKTILSYVGLGLQAFQSILGILTGSGIINPIEGSAIAAIIALVKAGFADLQVAVDAYNTAPADQKATLEQKIATALAILENHINQFWHDLQLPNSSLATTIEALLNIILSTLAGFAIQLPAPLVAKKKFAKMVAVTPKKRSLKDFKRDFNAVLKQDNYSQFALR